MASKEQHELMDRFEGHSCVGFLDRNEVKANKPLDFVQRWRRHIKHLQDVADDCDRMLTGYENKHAEAIEAAEIAEAMTVERSEG